MSKFRLNNPLPSSMVSECRKCSKILSSFINPRQNFGPEKIIPPYVLQEAKGLAILTVFKAGFLGSARFGSGLVVARRDDGSWSPPSAIATAGAGFGGQFGFELTDFVFILNHANAVKTFAQAGSLTLGGNVSIAAGPVGRNAEAAGAASLKGVSGIFAYSKTKGLFAGVSLEGSAIIERRDANETLYGERYTASQLLMGSLRPPPEADSLMAILNSRAFTGFRSGDADDSRHDGDSDRTVPPLSSRDRRSTASWRDDMYDAPFDRVDRRASRINPDTEDRPTYKDEAPGRPTGPKPGQTAVGPANANEAVAIFTFEPDQVGDMGFKKGEIITVTKKTDSGNDWWTGIIGTRHGVFPSNYVKMVDVDSIDGALI